MKPYILIHQDTCLPDYWRGHHLPVVQIMLTSETTYQDVYDELIQWDCYDHIDNVNDLMFVEAVEELFSTLKASQHEGNLMEECLDPVPVPVPVPAAADASAAVPKQDEDDVYAYAYFTLNKHDTPEELEEYAEELETMYNDAVEDKCTEEAALIAEELRQDAKSLSYDKMVEIQLYHWPMSKILTEDQVWMYINHMPPESRAKDINTRTMELAKQYTTHHVYYILHGSHGAMGIRCGVRGQDYISSFSYGRGYDGE